MKLVDCFLAFLVVVGVLQFVYAVVGGSYVSFALLCLVRGVGFERLRLGKMIGTVMIGMFG